MMKNIILTLTVVLAMASGAFAGTANLTATANIGAPPISIQKDGDMVVQLYRDALKTAYKDIDPEWQVGPTTPAKFMAAGDKGVPFVLTIPGNIVLTSGVETATVLFACRADNTAYTADKTAGVDCGASTLSHATTGKSYLAFYATDINFSAGNIAGLYIGTLTVSINYI